MEYTKEELYIIAKDLFYNGYRTFDGCDVKELQNETGYNFDNFTSWEWETLNLFRMQLEDTEAYGYNAH